MNFIDVDSEDASRSPLLKEGTVALGFFDGCHIGHQKILKKCREIGQEKAAVFTFPNHPTTAIPGRAAPTLVTTSRERVDLLKAMGLKVFLKTFDRDFSSWSAEHFVSVLLKEKLGVKHVVVGHDYRFGHRAAGDVALLSELGSEYGFDCTVIGAVMHEGVEPFVISSTRIRQAVAEGDLMLAHQLMGRPFSVRGTVLHGQKRGRTIGFPTANLAYPEGKVAPPFGVVAVKAKLKSGESLPGVANFGLRPTVESGATEPLLEVHLFDYSGDLYDQDLQVEMLAYVREECKFESFEELKAQIEQDSDKVRDFFRSR